MSHEGLRKIELGERVPTRETLDRIIEVSSIPEKKADELRKSRDLAQSTKVGMSLPPFSNDAKIRRLANRSVVTFMRWLGELGYRLPTKEQKALLIRLEQVLRKEIRG